MFKPQTSQEFLYVLGIVTSLIKFGCPQDDSNPRISVSRSLPKVKILLGQSSFLLEIGLELLNANFPHFLIPITSKSIDFSLETRLGKTKTAQHPMLAVSGKLIPLIGHVPNYLPRSRGK
jgi:hypothetical protein